MDVAQVLHRKVQNNSTRQVNASILQTLERIITELGHPPATLRETVTSLQELGKTAAEIGSIISADDEIQWWASAFERSCNDHRDDLLHLAAWAFLPPPPEQLLKHPECHELLALLNTVPNLHEVAALPQSVLLLADSLSNKVSEQSDAAWLRQLCQAISASALHAADRINALEQLAGQCQEFADMDFSFLFDGNRDLFAIGYNVGDQRRDNSFYDLLASESRLASYVMIAQGQVTQEHWFALGRMLTSTGGATTLLSWSGSMFEYLMPLLVMPTYEATLLDQTYRASVRRQIAYGKQRGVPWGMSESGYNTIDAHMNYQYRAFGVPGLGLKRGLAEDLVIAPYASVLALMVDPEAACANLERLTVEGHDGAYGLYEAVDYTPSRIPTGVTRVTVRQFMAHHQGMSLLALAYLLLDRPMQRRFAGRPGCCALPISCFRSACPRRSLRSSLTSRKPVSHGARHGRRGRSNAGLHRPGWASP